MTPKEKARQLFDKYNSFDFNTIVNQTHRRYAKQCALIAVDEILKLRRGYFDFNNYMNNESYWRQVKQEIEAL